ncbi:hypothetical protein [Candidatus Pristimantibacillus sp. PTI5]|uniref:hypothetical protein n=1 Tax=Candidatus Pristimantibacillus sp. PTI5 TaxID=3400422 RepID=UPI003B01C793
MNSMKRLLLSQRPVFVAGMLGGERYEWFRALVNPQHQSFIPGREQDEGVEFPLFFFPSEHEEAWVEYQSGAFAPLSTSSKEADSPIAAKYFPVSKYIVPEGFIFIVLSPYGKTFEKDVNARFNFDSGAWRKLGARLLWMDTFPYAKLDSIELLTQIKADLGMMDTKVCLMRSGRKYAYSDVSNEVEALKAADQEWVCRGLCSETKIIDLNPDRSVFTSLLYGRHAYVPLIQEQVKRSIEDKQEVFKRYFHEDYDLTIMSLLTADLLEPIFEYSLWRKSKKGLIQNWNKQLLRQLFPVLEDAIKDFLEMQLSGIELVDISRLVNIVQNTLWKEALASTQENIQELQLPPGLDKLQYMAAINKHKVMYIEAFHQALHVGVRRQLEELILRHYALWEKLA